jgi:hypothetical protein
MHYYYQNAKKTHILLTFSAVVALSTLCVRHFILSAASSRSRLTSIAVWLQKTLPAHLKFPRTLGQVVFKFDSFSLASVCSKNLPSQFHGVMSKDDVSRVVSQTLIS